MSDYVLEGPKWGTTTLGTSGGTVTWAVDSSVPTGFVSELSAAFADWAKWANIQFQEVTSTAAAAISFRFGSIDGLDKILGQTGYTYLPNSTAVSQMESANIEFDSDENWHQSGSQVVSQDGVNFFVVALHEIGHAIGLAHYNAAPAIMNSDVNFSVSDLQQSDIDGAEAIYGMAPTSLFGSVVHDFNGNGGAVLALYEGLLHRAPDLFGFENYIRELQHGASVQDVAGSILGSAEAHQFINASDNSGFVQQLYQSILGRGADAGGLASYTNQLNGGASRGTVASEIALSTEHQNDVSGVLNAGVFAPNADAADTARLYYGVLGRTPDTSGLSFNTAAVDRGVSLHDLAQNFLNSPEYQTTHGGLDNTGFVQSLYSGALGRSADAGGLATYTGALSSGSMSRADVAVAISESQEAKTHLVGSIESGFHLA